MDNITVNFMNEPRNHIVLIGMPFSGKSTVGAALGVLMGREWIDSDSAIEKKTGKSIEKIFNEDGETSFRKLEEEHIAEVLKSYPLKVISIGGGAYQSELTRNLCKEYAYIVWIKPNLNTILERIITRGESGRPLFKNKNPLEVLNKLSEERYNNYTKCHLIVDANNTQRPQEIAASIQASYNRFNTSN